MISGLAPGKPAETEIVGEVNLWKRRNGQEIEFRDSARERDAYGQ